MMRHLTAILCALGRHRPADAGRWHRGYGFTTCAGCGVVLVRSMLGDWHVPRHHRVVWRPREDRPAETAGSVGPAQPTEPVERVKPAEPVVAANTRAVTTNGGSPFDFSDFDRSGPTATPAEPRARPPIPYRAGRLPDR